jgi:hypothetical protein
MANSHSARDQALPWLGIANDVPDNAIALAADVFEDWVRDIREVMAKDYGSDLANGISISDADNFIMPVDPVRPQSVLLVDINDPADGRL